MTPEREFIPFNKPFLCGRELQYIEEAVKSGKLSGNGYFTKKCQAYFETVFPNSKCLMTTSCTDALEMCAILLDIKPGDEVIVPSYTFVSTANAFLLRGAKIVFADSMDDHPNIDAQLIGPLITEKTKAIVVVHYAGVACDMNTIMALANDHNIFVVEDAAQAIDSYFMGSPLGSFGHLAAFSFHETKNIISGEGGLLVVNDNRFASRAEVIWEKGTNRTAFFKGEVDKYGWVDIGSSFLPSEVVSAFLWAQIEHLPQIQDRRKAIWEEYNVSLQELELDGSIRRPILPEYATRNGHMFYIICDNEGVRDSLITFLKSKNILAVFHYLPLHQSPFYANKHDGRALLNSIRFSTNLLRLPLYYELSPELQSFVIKNIKLFFKTSSQT